MRIAIAILVILSVALLAAVLTCVDKIPSNALTRGRMMTTEQRIREYVAVHHCFPTGLSDLPPLEKNRDGDLADGWGRPIQYTIEGQTVTLLSLGKDGRPGGTGQDADIQVSFTIEAASSQSTTTQGNNEDKLLVQ
jgi:type II secretory pathway pseudopilin PulG